MLVNSPPLVLASASPRRADLLASAGFRFTVEPPNVDESEHLGESPEAYVLRVAIAKADAVMRALASHSLGEGDALVSRSAGASPREACRNSGNLVLGADTAVVLDGQILGKAETADEAFRMLKRLSGVVHSVYTGIALVGRDFRLSEIAQTRVHLLPITDDEIHAYVATGEPLGKAGGYAIQGRAARFVDWIEGSWSNVVGLPLATLAEMLKRVPR